MSNLNFPNGYAADPNPRTLLLPDPDRIPHAVEGIAAPIIGAFIGGIGVASYRYLLRRPLYSGIQLYPLVMGAISGFAYFMSERKKLYDMDRDAVIRHYIELHPEDFPPPERKKIGEVFKSFKPVR